MGFKQNTKATSSLLFISPNATYTTTKASNIIFFNYINYFTFRKTSLSYSCKEKGVFILTDGTL